jgi:hypothetical protein
VTYSLHPRRYYSKIFLETRRYNIKNRKGLKIKTEEIVETRVAAFLKSKHPDLIWRFDFAAGTKLTPSQAKRAKKINGPRGYPDLFIAEPRNKKCGYFIELKGGYSDVFNRDGSIKASEHLMRQLLYQKRLQAKGYAADWGLGAEDTISKIKKYLGGVDK